MPRKRRNWGNSLLRYSIRNVSDIFNIPREARRQRLAISDVQDMMAWEFISEHTDIHVT